MVDIASDGGTQGTCEGLEDGLGLVVLVVALGLDVEVHACGVAKALEEMEEHFRGHVADALAVERCAPDEPRPSAEVEAYVGMAVVHRQGESVAFDAALVAQGFEQALAQGQGGVLDGMVFVHVEVALGVYV